MRHPLAVAAWVVLTALSLFANFLSVGAVLHPRAPRCYAAVAEDIKEHAEQADALRLALASADAKDPLNEMCRKDPKACAVK